MLVLFPAEVGGVVEFDGHFFFFINFMLAKNRSCSRTI